MEKKTKQIKKQKRGRGVVRGCSSGHNEGNGDGYESNLKW